MSVKVMGLVWDEPMERGMKFVLLAYADHADHEGGNIFPAIETISKKTGYDERSVQRLTTKLEQAGYLVLVGDRAGGPGKSTHWRISVKGDKLAPIAKGDKKDALRVTKHAIKGDKVSPDPSLTIPEPSEEETPPRKKTNQQSMFGELAKVTGIDYKVKRNAGRLARISKELLDAGYLPETVEIAYSQFGWWYKNDWRGQKGEMPTPEQIVETIGRVDLRAKVNGHSPQPARQIILPDGQIVDANGA